MHFPAKMAATCGGGGPRRPAKATAAVVAAPTQADYVALESQVRRQRHALILLTLANLAIAIVAVIR